MLNFSSPHHTKTLSESKNFQSDRKKISLVYEKLFDEQKKRIHDYETVSCTETAKNATLNEELCNLREKKLKISEEINILKEENKNNMNKNRTLKDKLLFITEKFNSYREESERNQENLQKNIENLQIQLVNSSKDLKTLENRYKKKIEKKKKKNLKKIQYLSTKIKKYETENLSFREKLSESELNIQNIEKIKKDQEKYIQDLEKSKENIEKLSKLTSEQEKEFLNRRISDLEQKYIEKLEFLERQSNIKLQEVCERHRKELEVFKTDRNILNEKKILVEKEKDQLEIMINEIYKEKNYNKNIEYNNKLREFEEEKEKFFYEKEKLQKEKEKIQKEKEKLEFIEKEFEENWKNTKQLENELQSERLKILELIKYNESFETKLKDQNQKKILLEKTIEELQSEIKILQKENEKTKENKQIKEDEFLFKQTEINELKLKLEKKEIDIQSYSEQILNIKSENNLKNHQISSLKLELETLKSNFEIELSTKSKISSIERENMILHSQLNELQSKSKQINQINSQTTEDLSQKKKLLDQKNKIIEEINQKNLYLEKKNEKILENLKKQTRKYKEIIYKCRLLKQNLTEIYSKTKEEIRENTYNFREDSEKISNIISKQIKTSIKQLNSQKKLIESKDIEIYNHNTLINQLKNDISLLKMDLSNSRSDIFEKDKQITSLKNDIFFLQKENQSLKTDQNFLKESIKQESEKIDYLQKNLSQKENIYSQLENSILLLKKQFESEKNILYSENSDLKRKISLLIKERESLSNPATKENDFKIEALKSLRLELDSLYEREKEGFNTMKSLIERLRNEQAEEIDNLEQNYKEMIEILKKNDQNTDWETKKSEYEYQIRLIYEEKVSSLEELVNQKVFEQTIENEKNERVIKLKNREIEKLKEKINEIQIENKDFYEKMRNLETENSALNAQINNVQFQIELRNNQLNLKHINISEEISKNKEEYEIPNSGRSNSSYSRLKQKSLYLTEKQEKNSNFDKNERNSDAISKKITELRQISESISTNPLLTYKNLPDLDKNLSFIKTNAPMHKYSKSSSNFLQYSNKLAEKLKITQERKKSPEHRAEKSSLI